MSYLIERKKKMLKQLKLTERKAENSLDQMLCNLINEVKDKVPKNSKIVLYDFSGSSESELALIKNLSETYALTSEGIIKLLNLRYAGELSKLKIKKLNPKTFVNEVKDDPEYFEKICKNLQKAINKYKIKIDLNNYDLSI
ncbi:MAG: hypothetical protein QXD43_04065 [Candidatus Aenigmatarchaeota archaeon]